ncbi:MAG: Rpn family recombination-promoting nuclease/putative transposase [Bacteroidetes bacterium]|nr:Rpn family recombination-promoting nuclease/putative transposase [Bacteroidota bacterium]
MPRYLDPKNDLIFKRIFGEHPNLLIKFLNAIMPLEQGRIIEEIQYLPTEQVPDVVGKKNSIVDVKCVDNLKNQFIVEMQMYWSEAFNNRMVFNAGKAYVRQLNKKEDYNLLKPVYTLAIINDIFDRKTDKFYHHFEIVNKENTNETIKGLEFVLIELPKFQPQNWKDRQLAVLWLRFLNEVGEDMRTLPAELQENDDIRQAAELCEQAAFTPEELENYDNYWDAIRIEKTVRNASLREGETKKAIQIAKKMLEKCLPLEDISEITGLSIYEINAI